jgi:hypothetical protein
VSLVIGRVTALVVMPMSWTKTEDGIVGLSLEVVESWVKGVTEPKQLDKLMAVVERQRVVLADKAAAKAQRKAAAVGR